MKTYRELLKTDTYWITKIQNDLFNAVELYLAENNLTRTQFAEQLGVTKGYVSQVLSGEFNHRLSKLIEISLAIEKVPIVEFEDLDEVAEKESAGFIRRKSAYVKRAPFSIQISHGAMEKESILHPEQKHLLPNAKTFECEGSWEMKSPVMIPYASTEARQKIA